jgi:hypothetical protein
MDLYIQVNPFLIFWLMKDSTHRKQTTLKHYRIDYFRITYFLFK